jgi:hypothetical protein
MNINRKMLERKRLVLEMSGINISTAEVLIKKNI